MARAKDQYADTSKYFTGPVGHIKDRIIVHQNPDIPSEGLFVSLNGFAYLIPPEVEVDIPRPVRQMLDTRIRTETRVIDRGPGQPKDIQQRNIRRVTYTLVKADVGEEDPPAAGNIERSRIPYGTSPANPDAASGQSAP